MGTLYEVNGTSGNITSNRIFGSTQWSKSITTTNIPNGTTYNMSLQFANSDKVTGGTTSYDEWPTVYGIDLVLSGTSGTANINIDGTDYLATYATATTEPTDLAQTAKNWVDANKATLKSLLNLNVSYVTGTATIRFCGTEALLNAITITNVTTDLSGTLANGFTGLSAAAVDHFIQPYTGKAYEGQRIQYNIRVNFNLDIGSTNTIRVGLYRFRDNSLIGSTIPIIRNADDPGQQIVFISYTADGNDPFVDGGFYFLISNDSGTNTIDISGNMGFLIQYYYENPTSF
jgi:hypothetical protein